MLVRDHHHDNAAPRRDETSGNLKSEIRVFDDLHVLVFRANYSWTSVIHNGSILLFKFC
jgi:hypothetical protein